jgi:hypothetical protein
MFILETKFESMANSSDFKQRIRDLITEDRTQQALKLLRSALKDESNFLSVLVLFTAEYNRIADRRLLDIAKLEDTEREFNSLNYRLLQFIEKLTDEDIKGKLEPQSSGWTNKILVFTFSEKSREEMLAFFRPLNFENVSIETVESYDPKWNNTADLTIWDNQDLPICTKEDDMDRLKERERAVILRRLPFLIECLKEFPSPHFIHFGQSFFLVNDNRNCVNAANSFYSLFARIRETLDYINTYRV